MTKEELITNLILLGFVQSTVQWNRYKYGRGISLILVDFNKPMVAHIYGYNNVGKNKLEASYEEALEICVKILSK